VPTDSETLDPRILAAAVAYQPGLAGIGATDLVPMPQKGVAHAHFRIGRHGLVLRVPRLSQWALAAADNLAYQAECFRRAAPSGATPKLHAVLPISEAMPRGALLVEEIVGRPPRLPEDLDAIGAALARLHALPLPEPAARKPLVDHGSGGPIAGTLAVIERQVSALDTADLAEATREALRQEIAWARRLAAETAAAAQPIALAGTDTHPGNFVIRPNGEAILVDLEKAAYGSPAIDLAHASLVTSTTWDIDVQAILSREHTLAFYRGYLSRIGDVAASRLRPFLAPARRLTWLRTTMWCVRWRVAAATDPDWSTARVDPTLLAHMTRRITAFCQPEFVAAARAEWLGETSSEL
jgi:Ser/Thr protein kinase RdoA (MazF antagonist)